MKRIPLALGLSALTLVGGHFFNRRWDRAVLLFVALVFWAAGVYVSANVGIIGMTGPDSSREVSGLLSSAWTVFVFGVFALWLVSLAVTFLDARRWRPSLSHQGTLSGMLGAVGLSVVGFALLLIPLLPFLVSAAFEYSYRDSPEPGISLGATSYDRHFSHYVYLGSITGSWDNFSKPPSGDGHLRGRFVYDGKPAAGVRLRLVLNGKHETDHVTTDASGVFTVRLPVGAWTVNRLVTDGWADRPKEGNFIIISGTEPKLADGRYEEHYWARREGIEVTVGDQPGEPQLNFTIRKRITFVWPKEGEKRSPTTVAEGVIAWEPYPRAATYLLKITELERAGRTTRFHPVTIKPVTGATQFALSSLTAVRGEEEKEYQASVLAFAQDGSFLSESNERFDDLTFVLSGKQQFVRESESVFLSGGATADNVQELRENGRRLQAAEVLIKDDMLDEAERVLAKIKGQVDPGKKAAITGHLLAKRGRCDEAKRLFAEAEGASGCVPDCYRATCGK